MKLTHFANKLFVEFLSVGGFMKVKIAAKKFIAAFSRKNHFNSH